MKKGKGFIIITTYLKKTGLPVILLLMTGISYRSEAQSNSKEIIDQYQTWVSINNVVRISGRWGAMADVHLRSNHFFESASFFLVRIGGVYWLTDNTTLAAGYTNIQVAQAQQKIHRFSQGNWFYQQVQHNSKIGKLSIVSRLRNELRWQQLIEMDTVKGNLFSNRIRLLVNCTIPVSGNYYFPSLNIADELMVQFGKDIVYNTFDQNRIFIGIKQSLSKTLSFDLGYMMVLQQRPNGYQYNRNHTFRWFFYYRPDLRKHT